MDEMSKLWKNTEKTKFMAGNVSKKLRIAVAMSGGVDSSVSAWLLKKQGYDVSGFFMNLWSDNNREIKKSEANARKMAKAIGVPFVVLDFQKEFKKTVVDYFINEYKNLMTPNPCVFCNKFIKFGWFLDVTRKNGFDLIATGHYAKISKDKNNIFHLLAGDDETRDQSYFLYRLNQNQLAKVIFPVGEMTKKEVISIARKYLPIPKDQKESREICFLGDENYRDFLKKHLSARRFRPGDVIDWKNNIVGQHAGLPGYTIGQRRGLEWRKVKNENRTPLYVIGFDRKNNRLLVGNDKNVYSKEAIIKNIAWISDSAKAIALKNSNLAAKIRYRHLAAKCKIKLDRKNKSRIKVIFSEPQRAITPGQSLVFYQSKEVLGGGIIEK